MMVDHLTPDDATARPDIVEVLPVEVVEPLMARHEGELDALRRELAATLRQAEAAEERLRAHPAAAVFDDAFEAGVLAHLAHAVADIEGVRAGVARAGSATTTPLDQVAGASSAAHGRPQTIGAPSTGPPLRAAEPPPSSKPHTVVVDRTRPGDGAASGPGPRTVVVDRSRPTPLPHRVSPAPSTAAGPTTGTPGVGDGAVARGRRGGPTRKRRSRQWQSRVLIQAGVAIILIALLLLKLS